MRECTCHLCPPCYFCVNSYECLDCECRVWTEEELPEAAEEQLCTDCYEVQEENKAEAPSAKPVDIMTTTRNFCR